MTGAVAERSLARGAEAGFGLYVHWPFCLSKCPYCDFNSHVRDGVDRERWEAALLAELDHFAAETNGRELTSVFFGGGTPSLMAPATVAALLDRAIAHWPAVPDLEITLEANPTSAEASRLADFRAAGVNRVSLGVQALDDADLRVLGRGHDAADAVAAVRLAARTFDRYSFDMIYARPGQTVAGWRRELTEALALADGHLSAYQLTVEPGTAFLGSVARGELALPDEDTAAALYETTWEITAAAGLPAYEISNHARPGEECRHNLTYWRMGDYVGVGPGAHGRLSLGGRVLATRTHRAPEVWLERVEARGHGEHPREPVEGPSLAADLLMMGLRLTEGVSRSRFRAACGGEPEDAVDGVALGRLSAAGLLETDDAGLRATPEGRLRLNAVLGALLG
jgi:oxygen-independent coproporphyrinogen-3 oxidase